MGKVELAENWRYFEESGNMTSSSSQSSGKLLLKGSSKIVADYFEFAINSILFQRGIYPQEDFITVKKYGLQMLLSNDDEVRDYIQQIMKQIKKWIYGNRIGKLVVVILSKSTTETIERWEFSINIVQEDNNQETKSTEQIQREIQAIIRQITSSVTFLPTLDDDEYTFNVLVHTDPTNENVPMEWADAQDKLINGTVESVSMRNFQTNVHNVGTTVQYKRKD